MEYADEISSLNIDGYEVVFASDPIVTSAFDIKILVWSPDAELLDEVVVKEFNRIPRAITRMKRAIKRHQKLR